MKRALLVLVVLLAVGGVAAGLWWVNVGAPRASQRAAVETADAFLDAWSAQDWPAVAARISSGRDTATQTHRQMMDVVQPTAVRYEPQSVVVDGASAAVDYRADIEVSGIGSWTYDGDLEMERVDGEWMVVWEPSVVHPSMTSGSRFDRTREWLPRGSLLSVAGDPLVSSEPLVVIGVEPRRITDTEQVVRALVDEAGAGEDSVRALLDRPDLQQDWFHPVTELPRSRFDEVDAQLRPIPGILFRTAEGRGGPVVTPQLVGRAGEVTAEVLEDLGPPYEVGDTAGLSGLERAMDDRLAGTPALEVRIVDDDGEVLEVVQRVDATAPADVRTTLDVGIQRAADQALDGVPGPAALVVVDVATGGLRAVANSPREGFGRALAGRYPPGSTFKVVTSAALLAAGMGPDDVLDCPGEANVGGRRFRNAGELALGPITHRQAFARSCNTAYVGQAGALDGGALRDAARAFGFVDPVDTIPLADFGASFPEPNDLTDLAASSIGQGRVEASPAHMASVAAATATGTWRSPILIADDAPEERPIPGDAAVLTEMMRAVVTEGTGTAAAVPGEPVAGKTGSAEFGTATPPETHAWFIGHRGGLAFAVLVEGGGAGGAVAAPIAARFLELLG